MKRFKARQIYLLFILILSGFLITGCGSGGGEVTEHWAPADTTKPWVTAVVPLNNATGVAINTKIITAAFSEAMLASTITATGTFTVSCPGYTPVTTPVATYVETGYVATLTLPLTPDLPDSTVCTATVTTVATDLADNAIASDYVWTFTTGTTADVTAPTITLENPADDVATGVVLDASVNATFSKAMDPATICGAANLTAECPVASFTLAPTETPGSPVTGVVTYDPVSFIATFNPTGNLLASTEYTATVTNAVTDVTRNHLVAPELVLVPHNPWIFTTGTGLAPGTVPLGSASTFGISATAGVTNTPTTPLTNIHGDVVLGPTAECNAVSVDGAGGFGLCGSTTPTSVPIINTYKVISHFYDPATPPYSSLATIQADLLAAFLSITPSAGPPAAGSLDGATSIAAGTTLGAVTGSALVSGDNYFTPGVYQSLTEIIITDDLTLDAQGDPNARFVFQSSSTTKMAAGSPTVYSRILLVGGAKASNVWWQVGTSATLGLYSEFQGNILASASITMEIGATSCGRLMAGAFTAGLFVFDANVVSVPGQPFAPGGTRSTTCQ